MLLLTLESRLSLSLLYRYLTPRSLVAASCGIMSLSLPRLTRDDYTVACICPMGVELAPVEAMLDEIHQSLPSSLDKNSYTLGRMEVHNVVIAVMPEIGNNSAAAVATQLMNDFKSIRFGLLVGIGGGIPDGRVNDIQLGDIVVSKPTDTYGGVVQFDRGKAHSNGRFERTGTLGKPPTMLRAAVEKLEAKHRREDSDIPKFLLEMLGKFPKLREEHYIYQGEANDQLFDARYPHHDNNSCPYNGADPSCRHHGDDSCRGCDSSKIIRTVSRTAPKIHYGTIGSSNMVIKDGVIREQLRQDLGLLCVEMEAAGLMDSFSCLVIRGICDYADSHKNKRWQPYAAATAAAYAKELLRIIPAQEIEATTKAVDAFRGMPDL
jgi:nucleoside phosphorylase